MKRRLTDEDVLRMLELGREVQSVEFKTAGSRKDRPFLGKVIRAVLGLSNTRDGGYVLLGVSEGERPTLEEFDPVALETWEHDTFADNLARYAAPSVSFDLYRVDVNGSAVVVIAVDEFSDSPVLCARELHDGDRMLLRAGALYVRPRRKPETVEVSTYADMRDVLDLATEKSLRHLMARVRGAGVELKEGASAYDEELRAFRCPLQGRIEERGYWRISIRPEDYRTRVEDPMQLRTAMESLAVRSKGWSFPFYDFEEVQLDATSVHGSVDFSTWVECWRLYGSCQMVIQQGIQDDWVDQEFPQRAGASWTPGKDLDIATTICLFSDVWELAARIARVADVAGRMRVLVDVFGLRDRALRFRFPNHSGFMRRPVATLPSFHIDVVHETGDLIGDSFTPAMEQVTRLFRRFGWDVTTEEIKALASKVGCGRSG